MHESRLPRSSLNEITLADKVHPDAAWLSYS